MALSHEVLRDYWAWKRIGFSGSLLRALCRNRSCGIHTPIGARDENIEIFDRSTFLATLVAGVGIDNDFVLCVDQEVC